MIFKVI